jgi:O-acetyl-ADP-ribose deacetylase (regulator of RNase III)
MNRIENIDFCIRYLMQQNNVAAEIPTTLVEKQRLLRALSNIWEPQPLSDEFLAAQDAELQAQLTDKGVVEKVGELWQGDITRLQIDAIVNAANSQGLGCWHPLHACIDNAIHSAAGIQLRLECATIVQGEEPTGSARITKGYNLPSKFVIHTVGPIIPDGIPTPEQEQQLASCYTSCLALADQCGLENIVFNCISTGEYRFPNRRAAEIAVRTVRQFFVSGGSHHRLNTVVFDVFKQIDYEEYRFLLGKD